MQKRDLWLSQYTQFFSYEKEKWCQSAEKDWKKIIDSASHLTWDVLVLVREIENNNVYNL